MEYVNRLGTHSYKWDSLEREFGDADLLAMWVADMDFPSPKCVVDALTEYIKAPLGYFSTPDSYYDAVIKWEKKRHGYEIEKDWICITPGIVPALHWAVRTLTAPGDSVMISTPVYYPFMNAVNNSGGRKLVENELKKCGPHYEYDLERFEKDIVDPALGRKKVTTATVGDYSDMLITMAAASKTFNIAAVQNSFIIIPNKEMRDSFNKFLSEMSLDDVNGFGHIATEAALNYGSDWLTEILDIIYGNYRYLRNRFETECPSVRITDLEGTYLVWMDFSDYCKTQQEVKALLQDKCRLALDYGAWFGGGQHEGYARMNIATSRENIKEACDRIIREIKKL